MTVFASSGAAIGSATDEQQDVLLHPKTQLRWLYPNPTGDFTRPDTLLWREGTGKAAEPEWIPTLRIGGVVSVKKSGALHKRHIGVYNRYLEAVQAMLAEDSDADTTVEDDTAACSAQQATSVPAINQQRQRRGRRAHAAAGSKADSDSDDAPLDLRRSHRAGSSGDHTTATKERLSEKQKGKRPLKTSATRVSSSSCCSSSSDGDDELMLLSDDDTPVAVVRARRNRTHHSRSSSPNPKRSRANPEQAEHGDARRSTRLRGRPE